MNQEEVKKIKQIFIEIINKSDPWDLISEGAPDDEYNGYTDRVVSYVINKKPSVGDLKKELSNIFITNEFELSDEKISTLADNLLKSLKS